MFASLKALWALKEESEEVVSLSGLMQARPPSVFTNILQIGYSTLSKNLQLYYQLQKALLDPLMVLLRFLSILESTNSGLYLLPKTADHIHRPKRLQRKCPASGRHLSL